MQLILPSEQSGRVILLPSNTELDAATSKKTFLQSADAQASSLFVSNPPYESYRLAQTYSCKGHSFLVVVFFRNDLLTGLQLSIVASSDPTSWENWSEEHERRKNEQQVEMLVQVYGRHPAMFDWGSITSSYDSRSGESAMTVQFHRH